MGQEHSTALKKAFEKLDTDHNGQLNLADILTIQDVGGVEHLVHNGPLLLFRFDKTGDGAINYSEFSKLLGYVKSKEKELRAKGIGLMRKKVWCPINRETMNLAYELSRDASTPMITGQRPDDEPQTEEALEEVEGAVLAEEISRDAGEFFDQTVATTEGRKKFSTWLFHLTDTDNDNRLTADELVVLLRALRHDGINPEDLTYDPETLLREAAKRSNGNEETHDRFFASQLLREYDVENRGHLSSAEFEVLANLIVKNYELRIEYQENPEHRIRLEGFRLARRLGKGANGEVRLAVELKTGIRKAVKIVPKRDMAHLSSLDTEITAMMILKHPHIVKLDQVQEDDSNVFFIMELCGGGNISDYLDGKPMSETLARFYFMQIVEGVGYCHETGVAHRDLKLDNILLDNNANIKITDFGHAGIYKSGWDVFQTPLVGGLCHLAPEQILGQSYSGEKHDVWSLGVILYVLLSGHSPFTSNHPQQLLEDIKNVRYQMPKDLSREAKHLISIMLVSDSTKRPSIKEIAAHGWLTTGDVDAPLLTSFVLPVPTGAWVRFSCSSESMCHELKLVGIEPVYNASTIQSVADEHMDVRCHWPAKDVRFSFRVKEERSDATLLEFRLSTGASREFLSLMTKLKSSIAQRLRNKNRAGRSGNDLASSNLLLKSSSALVAGSARSSPGVYTARAGGTTSPSSLHEETHINDDLPPEDDPYLRPQIISFAELQQYEAAAAAAAREADAHGAHHDSPPDAGVSSRRKLKENSAIPRDRSLPGSRTSSKTDLALARDSHSVRESGHKSRSKDHHRESKDHRNGHANGLGSKQASPDSSESESDSLTTSAPVPHRPTPHHRHKHATPSIVLSGPPTHASHGEEIRRSRSVPAEDLAFVPPTGPSSHHHSSRHGEKGERSEKAEHRHTSTKHATRREEDDDEHPHDPTALKHLKSSDPKDHHDLLDTSGTKHRSTREKEKLLSSSSHATKDTDTTLDSSHSTIHKKKKAYEVPVSIVSSSSYVPGQVMTQTAGLVAWGNVASEPYPAPKSRRTKKSRNASASDPKLNRRASKKSSTRRGVAVYDSDSHPSLPVTSLSARDERPDRATSGRAHSAHHSLRHHDLGSSSDSESSLSDSECSSSPSSCSSAESSDESTRSRRSRSSARSRDRAGSPSSRASSTTRGRRSKQRSNSPGASQRVSRSRNPSPTRSRSSHHQSSSRTASPPRSRHASPTRSKSPVRSKTKSGRSQSRPRHHSGAVLPSEGRDSHRDSHHSKDHGYSSAHSKGERSEKADRLESSRDGLSRSDFPVTLPHKSIERDHAAPGTLTQSSHTAKESHSKTSLSVVPPPTALPTKVSKSFRRARDSKKGNVQSLPVSPTRKSPNYSLSSSSSLSSTGSDSSSSGSSYSTSGSGSSSTSSTSTMSLSDTDESDYLPTLGSSSAKSRSKHQKKQARSRSHAGLLIGGDKQQAPAAIAIAHSHSAHGHTQSHSKHHQHHGSALPSVAPMIEETLEPLSDSSEESPRKTLDCLRSIDKSASTTSTQKKKPKKNPSTVSVHAEASWEPEVSVHHSGSTIGPETASIHESDGEDLRSPRHSRLDRSDASLTRSEQGLKKNLSSTALDALAAPLHGSTESLHGKSDHHDSKHSKHHHQSEKHGEKGEKGEKAEKSHHHHHHHHEKDASSSHHHHHHHEKADKHHTSKADNKTEKVEKMPEKQSDKHHEKGEKGEKADKPDRPSSSHHHHHQKHGEKSEKGEKSHDTIHKSHGSPPAERHSSRSHEAPTTSVTSVATSAADIPKLPTAASKKQGSDLKQSRSAHHSPDDSSSGSSSSDDEDRRGALKKSGHRKQLSLGQYDLDGMAAAGTHATRSSKKSKKAQQPVLQELSESESDSAAPSSARSAALHADTIATTDRTQSLTSLSRKPSAQPSTAPSPRHDATPVPTKRSKSFKKERTKAHDAKHAILLEDS